MSDNTHNETVTRVVTTRTNKDAPEQQTKLTINWEGCTIANYRAYAEAGLIIKLQGKWRKNGIPANETVSAAEHAPGCRVATMGKVDAAKVASAVTTFTEAERKALMAQLMAMAVPDETDETD